MPLGTGQNRALREIMFCPVPLIPLKALKVFVRNVSYYSNDCFLVYSGHARLEHVAAAFRLTPLKN